jgi:hypothetical protein
MTGPLPESTAGCRQCWPEGAEAAWGVRSSLTRVADLIDDSHLGVAIHACPMCGQPFIATFIEEVDWADGDDPQYCSLMPVLPSEAARLRSLQGPELLTELSVLAPGRRSLRSDYRKGGPQRIYWGSGLILC